MGRHNRCPSDRPLNHEPVNDAMKDRAIIHPSFHQIQEISCRDRHILPQLKHDLTHRRRYGHCDRACAILTCSAQVIHPSYHKDYGDNGQNATHSFSWFFRWALTQARTRMIA
jgi:hypothetical protein